MLLHVTEALYEGDPDNDPYSDYDGAFQEKILKVGFTAAAIAQLCRELGVPIHIKWGGCKIESYTPERPEFEAVALYILGDHCYCVEDPATKRAIMKEPQSEPQSQKKEVLATIGRRTNSTPASQYWDTYIKLAPGHFYSNNLLQVRADLLREEEAQV